eukprot:scaffold34019_cov57-Phaeocystis_antarctica.AAC.2
MPPPATMAVPPDAVAPGAEDLTACRCARRSAVLACHEWKPRASPGAAQRPWLGVSPGAAQRTATARTRRARSQLSFQLSHAQPSAWLGLGLELRLGRGRGLGSGLGCPTPTSAPDWPSEEYSSSLAPGWPNAPATCPVRRGPRAAHRCARTTAPSRAGGYCHSAAAPPT